MHLPGRPEPPPVQGSPEGPGEEGQTVQGEQEERVQATPRLQLHHSNAHCGCHSLPSHRDTTRSRHCE